MPKSFSFEEKVFVLSESEKTTHIKDVYIEVFDPLLEDMPYQASSTLSNPMLLTGLSPKIKALVGSILNREMGSHAVTLPFQKITIDSYAKSIFLLYRSGLNAALYAQYGEKAPEKALKPNEKGNIEICSKYIFVYDVLLRMLAIAFCDCIDPKHDGKIVLEAISKFISMLKVKRVLLDGIKVSKFSIKLDLINDKLNVPIKSMIENIQKIHKHTVIITAMLDDISLKISYIKALLVILIEKSKLSISMLTNIVADTIGIASECGYRLSPHFVDDTLSNIEAKIMPKKDLKHIPLAYREVCVLNYVNDSKIKLIVTDLYSMLKLAIDLQRQFEKIDTMFIITGWHSIFFGKLNTEELSKKMEELHTNVMKLKEYEIIVSLKPGQIWPYIDSFYEKFTCTSIYENESDSSLGKSKKLWKFFQSITDRKTISEIKSIYVENMLMDDIPNEYQFSRYPLSGTKDISITNSQSGPSSQSEPSTISSEKVIGKDDSSSQKSGFEEMGFFNQRNNDKQSDEESIFVHKPIYFEYADEDEITDDIIQENSSDERLSSEITDSSSKSGIKLGKNF